MKRTRTEATTTQNPKPQEESNPTSKSQRRYKSSKCPQTLNTKPKTEEIPPVSGDISSEVAGAPPCTAALDDPLFVLWDELGGIWPWMVEQEVLAGWFPFGEGHFREFGEEEGTDLHDLWRLNEIVEVPN